MTEAEALIDEAIEEVIGIEGKYSFDPKDSGGETMWGITKAVALAHGYDGPMRSMPRTVAKRIYKESYFVAPGFHHVGEQFPALAKELFEIEVNCPPGRAATWLQMALNGLNDPQGKGQGTVYPDLVEDGRIGQGGATVQALRAYLQFRGDKGKTVLLRMVNAQQCTYYMERARKRPANERFLFGWVLSRVVI